MDGHRVYGGGGLWHQGWAAATGALGPALGRCGLGPQIEADPSRGAGGGGVERGLKEGVLEGRLHPDPTLCPPVPGGAAGTSVPVRSSSPIGQELGGPVPA